MTGDTFMSTAAQRHRCRANAADRARTTKGGVRRLHARRRLARRWLSVRLVEPLLARSRILRDHSVVTSPGVAAAAAADGTRRSIDRWTRHPVVSTPSIGGWQLTKVCIRSGRGCHEVCAMGTDDDGVHGGMTHAKASVAHTVGGVGRCDRANVRWLSRLRCLASPHGRVERNLTW